MNWIYDVFSLIKAQRQGLGDRTYVGAGFKPALNMDKLHITCHSGLDPESVGLGILN